MKLNKIGNNETEVILNNGDKILYSYSTPVAIFGSSGVSLVTSKKYSNTTTKHIDKWLRKLNPNVVSYVPQNIIDSYVP